LMTEDSAEITTNYPRNLDALTIVKTSNLNMEKAIKIREL